jgi:hypothetical protein
MATISVTRDITLSEEGKRIIREALADDTEVPTPPFIHSANYVLVEDTAEELAMLNERLKQKRKEMGLD